MNNSVKSQIGRGVFYTAIAKYTGIIVSLCVTAVLSRLLTPSDFGIIAIATVIISFFNIFCDLGFAPAIIQRKDLDKADLNSIFSLTIYVGLFIAIVFFFCAKPISTYYDNATLFLICKWLSINLLFATFNIVPNALLLKAKRFKFIALRTFIVQLFLGIISIITAFNGMGVYSLLINPIGTSVILFVVNYQQNLLCFSSRLGLKSIRKILSFSTYQFLFNLINYFSRNLDNLLIGRYIGLEGLGYYEKSYRLMMLPLSNITNIITPVVHPVLSDYQNQKDKLLMYYVNILKLLAFVGFPLSVILYFSATELVYVVFGNQWTASIPVFKILSLSVWIQILTSTLGSIFQSSNSTKYLFQVGLINTFINVTGIILAIWIYSSMEAVAIGIVITFFFNMVISFWFLLHYVFKKTLWVVLQQMIYPFMLALLLICVFWRISPQMENISNLYSLLIKGSLGVLISILFVQLTGQYNILKVFSYFKYKIK